MNIFKRISMLLWLVILAPGLALAQSNNPAASANLSDRRLPKSAEDVKISYAPLVKKIAPAVVNIITRTKVTEYAASPLMADPFFRQFFGSNFFPGMPQEREQSSLGSGVIARADGLVVTSNHVVRGADEITIILPDRRELPAKAIIRDEKTDLAILKIDAGKESFPTLPLGNSDDLEVGDIVLAVGNPFGVGQTVTSGIVSGLARTSVGISDYNFFIQTDAAINPGNSGGALVDMNGKLIGINTAIFSKGGGSNGIGFAIPANMVRAVMASVENGGKKVVRPWIGVDGQTVTSDIAQSIGMDRPNGVLIKSVHPQSPVGTMTASDGNYTPNAKMRVGDVILAINGHDLPDAQSLRYRLATVGVGQMADLTILRDHEKYSFKTKLSAPAEFPLRNEIKVSGNNPLSGIVAVNISPLVSDELDIAVDDKGVVVTAVVPRSSAKRSGIKVGDVILKINGSDIESTDDLRQSLNSRPNAWDVVLRRGDQVIRGVFR